MTSAVAIAGQTVAFQIHERLRRHLLQDTPDCATQLVEAHRLVAQQTGRFRLGGDQMLVGSHDKCWISFEDYAVALVGEIVRPARIRRRFSVGY
ncbi:MAG: hypothetical protein J0H38_05655 [Rhizobiales bacterium]|nr:hypothetical protein [Hyphomicrobiales bacterium]